MRPQLTCTGQFVKLWDVVCEICKQTDRHRQIHKVRMLHTRHRGELTMHCNTHTHHITAARTWNGLPPDVIMFVCLSVCWSHGQALQNQLKRQRCHFDGRFAYAQRSLVLDGGTYPCQLANMTKRSVIGNSDCRYHYCPTALY